MQAIDFRFFQLINQFAGKWHFIDILMTAIAKYGPVLFVVPIIYLWFRRGTEGKQTVILAVIGLAAAMLINQIIGHIYFRPRPFAFHNVNLLLAKSPDPSFPSDHAAFSFAIASVILLWDKRIGSLSVVLGFFIALSRVFVGLHYPFDVFGGAIIGSSTGLATWKARLKIAPLTSFVVSTTKKLKLG